MAPGAPDLGHGKGNLIRHSFSPQDRPDVTWMAKQGDIDQGFAGADFVKEFAYRFVGGVSVPMQPSGSVAKWDGEFDRQAWARATSPSFQPQSET